MSKAPYILLLGLLLTACSTKKNTAGSRWWQSFVTRYNVYYNGSEAYKSGIEAQEKGTQDNYTERLPLFAVGNEKVRSLGKSDFETAITKCEKAIQLHSIKRKPVMSAGKSRSPKQKAYLSRKEFNPFLKNAWLLMGKAQFQKGEFLEAASTFSYITRFYAPEPDVVAEARTWLARCYIELEWYYDAEDVVARMERDTLPPRLRYDRDATMADLLVRQEKFEEALPYLERTARRSRRKLQKARAYYLLGQINAQMGRSKEAYRALQKCIKQSPPYEMSFNARILQTSVLTDAKNSKSMIAKLKRMARSDNNKDYLDQVYYAIGNIYLTSNDTASAIGAYEQGRQKSTRSGVEKGVLLLRLGELYWDMRRFDNAQSCYAEAIGLIDKEREDYEEVMRRSKVLDELVPYTSAVHLQDSLQALSRMSEADRNAAIDRVIEALKKKEAEERRAKADSAAEARAAENGMAGNMQNMTNTAQQMTTGDKSWYFYNPMLVSQGKQSFVKQWGRRKNEDDWRRSNRTVVANEAIEEYDYEAEDSLAMAEATDSLETDSVAPEMTEQEMKENDPHERAYYMKQIPFTEEAIAASDEIIKDGLYNAGIIEKDKLEDFALAAETLERLPRQYPTFEKMNDVFYQLFLLYSRWRKPEQAERYRQLMQAQFPDDDMTRIISDPDFEYNARYGRELEDSLYTATYDAYRRGDTEAVARNYQLSTEKYPTGANRPKFMFVHTLSRLGTVESKTLVEELRELVKQYPKSDVSEMAGMIVNGLEAGRAIGSGTFDLGSLWSRRTSETEANNAAAGQEREFTDERDVPFVFLIAYPTDSVNDDKLLYELARFNFTSFVMRGFDISKERGEHLTQFRISGFNSFEEVHAYAQRVYRATNIAALLRGARVELISENNLNLLGTLFSYDDYRKYYDEHFAPLEINPDLPLEFEPEGEIEQHYEDEYPGTKPQTDDDDPDAYDDGGEYFDDGGEGTYDDTDDGGVSSPQGGEEDYPADDTPAEK